MKCTTCSIVRFSLDNGLCETCLYNIKHPVRETKPIKIQKQSINKEYREFLFSEDWKYFREQVIKKRKKCEACGTKSNLRVHHGSYQNGMMNNKVVFLLCDNCHSELHIKYSEMKKVSGTFGRKWAGLMKFSKKFISERYRSLKTNKARVNNT